MLKRGKMGVVKASLVQAAGIVVYVGLVSLIFWKGNEWFGKMNNYWGPLMVLTLFSVSALMCALIAFGYPFLLFWEEKKTKEALKLVIYETIWLAVFLLGLMGAVLVT